MKFSTFNYERLLVDWNEDKEEVFIILKMFYENHLSQRVKALHNAIKAQNFKEIIIAFYWIKGSFSYIYAEKIIEDVYELVKKEKKLEKEDYNWLIPGYLTILKETKALQIELDKFFGKKNNSKEITALEKETMKIYFTPKEKSSFVERDFCCIF